jgi:hypothetical protein
VQSETDPVWTAEKANYATGTPVYAESDPVWLAERSNYATGTPLYAFSEVDPSFSGWLDTNEYVQSETDPVWTAEKANYATGTPVYAESDPVFTNWLEETGLFVADVDVFFYHEMAVDGNSAIVVNDFGDYSSTPPKLAFGAYSTATNALQSMYRGGVLEIPDFITSATNIQIQVYGSSANTADSKIDITLYHPETSDTASFNGLATATSNTWTTHNLATTGTFLTNNLAGRAVRVRCRPYSWNGHTSAVERVWRIMQ